MLLSCMQKKGKMQSSLCSAGSLCSSTLTVVCVMVLLLCLAGSQAPGDGDQICIDSSSHPEYEDHTHPLMDSRDYKQVLPGTNDSPWQKLNLDENNQDNQKTEVCTFAKVNY